MISRAIADIAIASERQCKQLLQSCRIPGRRNDRLSLPRDPRLEATAPYARAFSRIEGGITFPEVNEHGNIAGFVQIQSEKASDVSASHGQG